MIEPKRHEVVGSSPLLGTVVQDAKDRCTSQQIPLRLTISVRKLDLLLTDIQHQVDDLQQQMATLRLVRTQLANCQSENGGHEEFAPQIQTTVIGIYAEA
jgi:hypothetical protein